MTKIKTIQYMSRSRILLLIILILSIFYSCTKIDVAKNETVDNTFVNNFFKVSKPVSTTVANIIAKLKIENERTNFVNNLPKDCGMPIWDKLLLKEGGNNNYAFRGGDSLEDIILPLTNNNQNLSSILILHDSISGYQVDCFTTNSYLYDETHGTNVDTLKAMDDLVLFFFVENKTFGTTKFYHIPTNLFSASHQLGTDGKKIITIRNDTSTIVNNRMIEICSDILILCSYCGLETCPLTWTLHHCITIGEGGGGGGGGSGPHGGGGVGSGGGGTGGGGEPCGGARAWYARIIEPNPCDPPPPPPPVNDTILDPCSDAFALQSSASFKSYMQELKDSTNSNREYGYFMKKDNNGVFGNTLLGLIQGPADKLSLGDFINNYQIDCFAHSHFSKDTIKGLSVFSPDDLWTMCRQFNDGAVVNPQAFSIALTTKSGTQYLLKIENLTKFRAWAHSFTQGSLQGYYDLFGEILKILPTNSNEVNEKRFLKYLKVNNGSGLKMFRGNSTFTQWQPIDIDQNDIVVNSTCI